MTVQAKLVIAGLLLVGGTVVAFAGASPEAAWTPQRAVAEATPAGTHITLKGAVGEVHPDAQLFTLTDGTHNVTVHLGHALPGEIQPGLAVVSQGTLVLDDGRVLLRADEVILGCPSKYA
ncbi:MAG: cytochrome c maturation protein CcmE [Candidatus Thermoplasmatota archaeon]|nr:cytochrome c maturation protein CcmE [Candidatus Thermoplasmatota archaeon]